jgi:hypothetical protein
MHVTSDYRDNYAGDNLADLNGNASEACTDSLLSPEELLQIIVAGSGTLASHQR